MARRAGGGIAVLLAALLVSAAFAGWQQEASPYDLHRLTRIDEARAKGLDEAGRGASPADLVAIDSILHTPVVHAAPAALLGNWRCRTIKLGGMVPDIIYAWFRCRISDKDGMLVLEKLTGTQRMQGTLEPDSGESFVYLGASYVRGERPHRYSGNAASAGAPATPDDQIGLLSLLADGRARLELPYPVQESTFDVLELKR
ncbi:MAG: DUF4893 domain-containing protein [Alphaproteobacteria bacterium]|nr:DUF4893 domain-containing protein [Alphaproteobacteria bacterium]